ncbi:MAG: lysophospholipid acyltransferase family protein [Byssovorax sp.]
MSVSVAADVREGGTWTPRQRLKNGALYAVVRAALSIVRRAPRAVVALLCRALGLLAWVLLARERSLVRARLAAGLGQPVPARRVRAVFLAAGDVLADTLALLDPRERAGRTMTMDAASHAVLRDALDEGRGVVYVAAHLGPWERMAALLAEEGFPVVTIARESYDPRLTALYERLRAPRRVRSIYRGRPGAVTSIVRELRAGRGVGFLIDLPSRVQSIRAPLFGAEARIPVGAARIALARGAAVVVGTPVPSDTQGLLCLVIERIPTSDLAPGPMDEAKLTTRLARALEARIAARPEAWLGLFAPPPPPDAEPTAPQLRCHDDPR